MSENLEIFLKFLKQTTFGYSTRWKREKKLHYRKIDIFLASESKMLNRTTFIVLFKSL